MVHRLAAGLAFAALAAPLAARPAAAADAPPRPQIEVTGTGEASGAPDLAFASFAVVRNAATAREALDAANRDMAAVIEGMRQLGVEARDLQTSGFGIAPQYRYDNDANGGQTPPVLVGYEVRNALDIRVRKVAEIGAILDKAVTLGANSGGEIRFGVEDPAALRDSARRKAVADATTTARTLATAAGVTLGRVVEIAAAGDATQPPAPMPMLRMAAAAPKGGAVPVEAGESTVSANVRMVFELGTTP